MPAQSLSTPRTSTPFWPRWRKTIAILLVSLVVVALAAYVARRTLLLNLARMALNRQSYVVSQEHADGLTIAFSKPPSAWITPMKTQMNGIWAPIKAGGVNYYMFAAPRTWLSTYSERSNPVSPYYQAWVGAYVIKRTDGTLPDDLQALERDVTTLDQRSWLSAMGDPHPLAEPSPADSAGNIVIDGRTLPLWHETMHSHSDLSARPTEVLATLIGMPPKSSWPPGVEAFHDVTLDGYIAGWIDTQRKVSVVVYSVAAVYAGQAATLANRGINDELLALMQSARVEIAP